MQWPMQRHTHTYNSNKRIQTIAIASRLQQFKLLIGNTHTYTVAYLGGFMSSKSYEMNDSHSQKPKTLGKYYQIQNPLSEVIDLTFFPFAHM